MSSAALKAGEMDHAALSKHVEQFKEISQASESALAQLMQTHEEYKASAEEELRKLEVSNRDFGIYAMSYLSLRIKISLSTVDWYQCKMK